MSSTSNPDPPDKKSGGVPDDDFDEYDRRDPNDRHYSDKGSHNKRGKAAKAAQKAGRATARGIPIAGLALFIAEGVLEEQEFDLERSVRTAIGAREDELIEAGVLDEDGNVILVDGEEHNFSYYDEGWTIDVTISNEGIEVNAQQLAMDIDRGEDVTLAEQQANGASAVRVASAEDGPDISGGRLA